MNTDVLQRAFERERERRKKAEALLEEKSRELYLSYEELNKSHRELEISHSNLQKQKQELVQLINAYASVTDDLNLAAKLQTDLLPDAIKTKSHAARGFFQPAKYVAGDAYDYFMLNDEVFAFYIIDVEGHGTASAMTSFAIHSQLNPKYNGICKRNLEQHICHAKTVCATVNDLNSTFYNENSTSKYFTMVYGLLDIKTGMATWCQAGHPAPILCTAEAVTEMGDGGFPVGTLENPPFEANTYTMQPNERLALYSDGAVECFSKNNEAFGKQRLFGLLEKGRAKAQERCVVDIQHALFDWNATEEFNDDVTMLIIDFFGLQSHL